MTDTNFGWIAPPDAPKENFLTGFAYQEYLAANGPDAPLPYSVTEYTRSYGFSAPIRSVRLLVSGDTEFRLYSVQRQSALQLLATGPANPGGDFRQSTMLRPVKYATPIEYSPVEATDTLTLCALVKGMPVYISEYSFGKTGFWLQGTVTLQDGTTKAIGTDTLWQTRALPAYRRPFCYDDRFAPGPVCSAVPLSMPVPEANATPVPSLIPPRTELIILPTGQNVGSVTVPAGAKQVLQLNYDKIYAAYPEIIAEFEKGCPESTQTGVAIGARFYETEEQGTGEQLFFSRNGSYTALQLHSVGAAELTVENTADCPVQLTLQLHATCYPVTECAQTLTSDEKLNKLLQICTHTLQYCRQQIHLDSPRHCEPLACTGDYYIETLMTAFSFGDMRLAAFDARRTADILRQQNGEMFHTSYSLIWVLMLWDIYLFTGDITLLTDCEDALALLLTRFEEYKGETGLPETPPSYMFLDWLYIDGISLHHPPKALGQGPLAMFLYGALCAAQKIYSALDKPKIAKALFARSEALRKSINALLWDEDRHEYFAGLNTPSPEEMLYPYLPQNVQKRYYLPHTDILAVMFGVCAPTEAAGLLQKICSSTLGEVQPYFNHFLFQAIYRTDLCKSYTLPLAAKWYAPIQSCGKGLPEGFIKPEPGYSFDHSHAWGGSPLWSVPQALTGLQIIKPGMQRLAFRFDLLGLDYATVQLPTPYGIVTCRLKKGEVPVVTAPPQIELQYDRSHIIE